MKITEIIYFGNPAKIVCDEKCNKAWGWSDRPKIYFDPDKEEDIEILKDKVKDWDAFYLIPDTELPDAPNSPGSFECFEYKPTSYDNPEEHKHNKWCCRACERCRMTKLNKFNILPKLYDFSRRVYNNGDRQKKYNKGEIK